jgi:hypothetical protein
MTRTGAVLKLDQPTERTADPAAGASRARPSRPAAQAVVGLTFEGANPDPAVAGQGLLEGVSNYLLGDDPDGWLTGVPNYSRVAYRDLYDGVSLEYYANRGGELEFDLTLAPGADPHQIRISYTGADSLRVDESGALVLRAGGGELRQAPSVVYQQVDGARRQVHGRYLLHGAGQVGFALAGYDAKLPLVIDPVISYSTLPWRDRMPQPLSARPWLAHIPQPLPDLSSYHDSGQYTSLTSRPPACSSSQILRAPQSRSWCADLAATRPVRSALTSGWRAGRRAVAPAARAWRLPRGDLAAGVPPAPPRRRTGSPRSAPGAR